MVIHVSASLLSFLQRVRLPGTLQVGQAKDSCLPVRGCCGLVFMRYGNVPDREHLSGYFATYCANLSKAACTKRPRPGRLNATSVPACCTGCTVPDSFTKPGT